MAVSTCRLVSLLNGSRSRALRTEGNARILLTARATAKKQPGAAELLRAEAPHVTSSSRHTDSAWRNRTLPLSPRGWRLAHTAQRWRAPLPMQCTFATE